MGKEEEHLAIYYYWGHLTITSREHCRFMVAILCIITESVV